MLERLKALRSAIRKNSRYNIFLTLVILNVLGITTMAIYFHNVLAGYDIRRSLPIILSSLSIILPVAFLAYQRRERPVTEAIAAVKAGRSIDPAVLAEGKRRLGRRPRFVAFMMLIGWIVGAIFNSSLNYGLGSLTLREMGHQAWATAVVANPVISLLAYFWTEIMSRNDMRVLEIDIDHDSIVLSVRRKILFTVLFVAILTIVLFSAVATGQLSRISGAEVTLPEGFLYQVAILAGLGLLYSVLAAVLLAHTITDPLRELMDGMTRVSKGELDTRVPITSTDETAVLTKNFNNMTQGLRERERLKQVFGHYVSPQFRDQILAGNIELGGEELNATILFADIRGFTTISEERPPAEVLNLLNQYFTEMVHAINRHGGVVDKYIGDALMAVFGVPAHYEDHAHRALGAAREMGERLLAHNELQRLRGEPELAIGIGINTGPMIAGNIGSDDRREYTAIGDTVNTASRIESMTRQFERQVLFTETTCQAAGLGAFVGEAEVRGRAGRVKLYGLD